MIVPADKPKEMEGNDEKQHIVSEALNETAPGPHSVSMIVPKSTLFTEPTTAEFLAKQSMEPFAASWHQPSERQSPVIPTIAMDSCFALSR